MFILAFSFAPDTLRIVLIALAVSPFFPMTFPMSPLATWSVSKILQSKGVLYPTEKVKGLLRSRGVEITASVNVQISQERAAIREELTGITRGKRGRLTREEQAAVERKLQVA